MIERRLPDRMNLLVSVHEDRASRTVRSCCDTEHDEPLPVQLRVAQFGKKPGRFPDAAPQRSSGTPLPLLQQTIRPHIEVLDVRSQAHNASPAPGRGPKGGSGVRR